MFLSPAFVVVVEVGAFFCLTEHEAPDPPDLACNETETILLFLFPPMELICCFEAPEHKQNATIVQTT